MFQKLYIIVIFCMFSINVLAEEKFSPYTYTARNEKSLKYFTDLLPSKIKIEIKKRFPQYRYLTSCSTDIDGNKSMDFIASIVDKNGDGSTLVFMMEKAITKKVISLELKTKGIKTKDKTKDYIETYCDKGKKINGYSGYEGMTINVKTKIPKDSPVIKLKTYFMDGFEVFMYDNSLKTIKGIGGIYPP